MIKFFRKIRQDLLSKGKTGKYMKYAIGEIVLVMIGILLALQVNNWNEIKNLENRTQESLSSLAEELNSNKIFLESNLNKVKSQLQAGLNMIDSLNNNSIPDEEKDTYLRFKISHLGPLRINSLTTSSLDEMINSGNYSSINSINVKECLLAYNSEIENMNVTLIRFEEYWTNIELPYLTKHFSLLDMFTRSETNFSEDEILIGKNLPKFNNQEIYFSHNLGAFYDNREFATMNIARYYELRTVLKTMNRLDKSIDNLLGKITDSN